MTWTGILFPLLILVCPLSMVFMMRGGRMGGGGHSMGNMPMPQAPSEKEAHEQRIADLEREVARLRGGTAEARALPPAANDVAKLDAVRPTEVHQR